MASLLVLWSLLHCCYAVIPPEFDCGMRHLALEFAQHLQPGITSEQLQDLADALNGAPEAQCRNITPPTALAPTISSPDSVPVKSDAVLVVSPDGNDAAPGTSAQPMRTILAAVHKAGQSAAINTILLKGGVYREASTIELGPEHSGLTIKNFDTTTPVISGAKPLQGLKWSRMKPASTTPAPPYPLPGCDMLLDGPTVARAGHDYKTVALPPDANISSCLELCCQDDTCQAVSYNTEEKFCRDGSGKCCLLKNVAADPTPNTWGPGVRTAYKTHPSAPSNVWTSPVAPGVGLKGLRVDGVRAFRARYPNARPEADLNPTGWISSRTEWLPPKITHVTTPPVEYEVTDPQWRRHDSTGNELGYQAGIGGSCQHLDPPYGYWCSAHPNRTASGALTHRWPSGLAYKDVLPNAPYKHPEGAIVHTCRGGANCWFTWMFEVDAQTNETLSWTEGGFQGAEGSDGGGSWYIENVLEELDAPNEYFFNGTTLFYFHNHSGPPPPSTTFESTELKQLLSVKGEGPDSPAKDIVIQGIEFRDTAYTYMDAHGMPSGGDWCLQRSGALRFENTEGVLVDGVKISRCDGNGVSINNYNRNLTVSNSELVWIGDTAIASWGSTEQGMGGGNVKLPPGVGIDGTGGNQPRGTRILGNIIHEFGLYQKQSSAYFQAQSCQTQIRGNIFYNGPRAHINFNDQFGGANNISQNLILNACRETADHGPFNSWGRQPYITKVRDGETPSITPAYTGIDRNFVIGSYHTQESIDNDDASEYFDTHHNFFAYGGGGLKSDFSGHDNHHHENIYAFVGGCMGVGSFLPGHEDEFSRNKCILTSDRAYARFACSQTSLPVMYNNTVYTPRGLPFDVCGHNFSDWQKMGHDVGTTVLAYPQWNGSIVGWARDLIFV